MNVFAAILLASTSLHITVFTPGDLNAKRYTLQCHPVGGTLPNRAAACRTLLSMKRPFAPTPKNVACAQIYGGPMQAVVWGRLRGVSVNARFTRKDGCAIARWNRVRFLFPVPTRR